ncbi:molecular chaperone DnaJ [Candidatus Cerribacteria bacterium 'Amazon FNV 2010 28 9']|uniref:Molecular chaperone DnaJ n=1 Tax=Candidatus Cerribacteria bacterium 'Amazon FNV 2010 28 9' TaxID=2081795 RepID=A0A317JML5_9BACT|nr:MAG: molecular chaperone DnaJ [Candidatus Cerribacteria bacterium 'Amazon FNV 2010 28 9']
MATTRDYYDILGISKSATAADIKSAYRKAALKYHPDRNKEAGAEAKFKEINEAYEVLGDESKRKNYDQFGHAAFQQGGFNSATGGNPFAGGFGGGPFTYTYSNQAGGNPFEGFGFGGGSDPFDIFESFFGGGMGRAQRKPMYGLEVDFMDAVKGATKTIEVDGKEKIIKIPAGSDEGTRIRFTDFDIRLSVRPHSQFKRDRDDIYVDIELPLVIAILGGEIMVPTVDGDVKLKIRPGTQPSTMMRLREQGVVRLHGRGKGDEYVRLLVKIPEKLTRQQRDALKAFE